VRGSLKTLAHQDLTDLVEGAAIFSGGGGGDSLVGLNIVEKLVEKRCPVRLIDPVEASDDEIVVNFACVGATMNVAYHGDAATKTLRVLEELLGKKAFAVIPLELGGFSTLTAVDVAARCGVPVVDADGAGRAVSELNIQVYAMNNVASAPMVVADIDAENIQCFKEKIDSRSAEQVSRALAAKLGQSVYVARPVLTGKRVRTSSVVNTLSASIRMGMLLRKAVDPVRAILTETNGSALFEGFVSNLDRETRSGFTWTTLTLEGLRDSAGATLQLKARNEFLAVFKNGKLVAAAPDIITAVSSETGKCVPAEKITEDSRLTVLAIPAPKQWRSRRGLELWREVMQRSGIREDYVPIGKSVEE